MKASIWFAALAMALPAAACGDDDPTVGPDGPPSPDSMPVPDAGDDIDGMTDPGAADYAFADAAYAGQIVRQLQMRELAAYLRTINGEVLEGNGPASIADELNARYYDWASDMTPGVPITIELDGPETLLQSTIDEIGDSQKLSNKIAGGEGNDDVPYTDVLGWADTQTPHELVQAWFAQLDEQATAFQSPNPPTGPKGDPITTFYITESGHDLRQLSSKFMMGAVAYSQATDDYLDTILENDNTGAGASYTDMEHHWDEGFGYFGAARNYNDYADDDTRTPIDIDGDGQIDLRSEYNFSIAGYAAGRDAGSSAEAPTNFSDTIFDAFIAGRQIITDADGALSTDDETALLAERTKLEQAWEKVFAANVVHYINETLSDLSTCDDADDTAAGCPDYVFEDVAEHWSEMKGFALTLQFNPRKQISDAGYTELHDLIRDAPALPAVTFDGDVIDSIDVSDVEGYRQDLLDARTLLGEAYGFDQANLENW